MAKINLSNVSGGFNLVTSLNSRLQQVEDALNNNVLYRDLPAGSESEPNQLEQDIDLNSNDILNVNNVSVESIEVRGEDLGQRIDAAIQAGTDAEASATTASSAATDATVARLAAEAAATSASISATSAEGDADRASLQRGLAQDAATTATNAASTATNAQLNASLSATQASTARDEAQTASGSAVAAAASANQALQDFRDTYYGAAASDPATDPNGNSPTEGDTYFNTTNDELRIFEGANWLPVSATSVLEATQAQAEAGALTGVYMSPLRVNQYVDTVLPTVPDLATQPEAVAGTDNTKIMTPLRTQQWFDSFKNTYALLGSGGTQVRDNMNNDIQYRIITGANNSDFYREATVTATSGSPSGDMTSGSMKIVRIGDVVTISGRFLHSSTNLANTAANSLPTWAQSSQIFTNTYLILGTGNISHQVTLNNASRNLIFSYRDIDIGRSSYQTETRPFSFSYLVL